MKKIFGTALAVAVAGGCFFGFLFGNGLSGIRVNPKHKQGQIKVACVGDSVTYGHSIKSWKNNNYPALLGKMLGEKYCVMNFGVSGSTVQPDGDQPYVITKAYTQSLSYEADIIVFMMGSNDSKPENWKGEEAFLLEYNKLIESYLNSEKKPVMYICTPPVAYYPEGVNEGLTNYDVQPQYVQTVNGLVKTVAAERDFTVIDINALTTDRRDLFGKDNVHPNNEGAKVIAEAVYKAITD